VDRGYRGIPSILRKLNNSNTIRSDFDYDTWILDQKNIRQIIYSYQRGFLFEITSKYKQILRI